MVGVGGGGRLQVVEKRHLPPAGVLPVHSGNNFDSPLGDLRQLCVNKQPQQCRALFLELRIASINTFASSSKCDSEQEAGDCPGSQLTAVVSESLSCDRTAGQGCLQRSSSWFEVWMLSRELMV